MAHPKPQEATDKHKSETAYHEKRETTQLMLLQHNMYSVLDGEKHDFHVTLLKHLKTFKTLTDPNEQN